jgi:hypothetical protein
VQISNFCFTLKLLAKKMVKEIITYFARKKDAKSGVKL